MDLYTALRGTNPGVGLSRGSLSACFSDGSSGARSPIAGAQDIVPRSVAHIVMRIIMFFIMHS